MGMSASQARLIALTARMNDIEYQGQQINQQRTTLSNQVNALYNQLLEMSVPTPPSTSDYTKVQYSGKLNASSFTIGNVVPTGKNTSRIDTYTVQFQTKQSGNSIEKSMYTATLTSTPKTTGVADASSKVENYIKTVSTHKPEGEALESTSGLKSSDEVLIKVSDYSKLDFINQTIYDANGKQLSSAPTEGDVYVSCKKSDLSKDNYNSLITTEDGKYTNVYKAGSEKQFKDTADDEDISSLGLYTSEDGKTLKAITTFSELKKAMGSDPSASTSNIYTLDYKSENQQFENPLYNGSSTGKSVGTYTVYKLSEAADKIDSATYKAYIESLCNAFPELLEDGQQKDDIANQFLVYFEPKNGLNIPHFIKNTDTVGVTSGSDKQVSMYDFSEDGTYTQTDNKKGCQLEFDSSTGRITQIGIPDDDGKISWVKVTAETVTDQDAYDEAFNDYEYEKNVYDKKQQEINAKTSIVQQQDKNLELKLTRLDNERNAVNTEIEAVKKVVSDNIEKSYKTFSG